VVIDPPAHCAAIVGDWSALRDAMTLTLRIALRKGRVDSQFGEM
jgi:hypothetical protein